jgi:hypothetical protein
MLRVVSFAEPSFVVLQTKDDQHRMFRKHAEERKRCGIDDAIRACRRHQRDRAGHYEAAEQLVAPPRLKGRRI